MKQLENSLSRVIQKELSSVVLLPQTTEFLKLIPLLLAYVEPKSFYCVLPEDKKVAETIQRVYNRKVKICDYQDLANFSRQIDLVLFDYGCSEATEKYLEVAKYIIGRMLDDENYFSFWENSRQEAEYIYIQQNRLGNKTYEIFEWEKLDGQIELSVIIPVYNVEQYLSQCIESLIEWKAPYVEYLFVDDGSVDHSADIIKKYAANDIRIKLIQKKNGGCASARNQGIAAAKGRYIGFVDADDFVDKDMFYKLLRRAMLGNYELTYCGYNEYYNATGEIQAAENDCLDEPYLTGTYRIDQVQLLTVNTRVAIWRCLYKKSVLCENNIMFHEDLKRFDDLPFRIEYIFSAKSAVCISERLYYYRLGRKGQDVSCTDDRLFVHFDIFVYLDRYVAKYLDRRMWDLLQVVKLQTHRYALDRIEKKYKKEYKTKAKAQLKTQAGYFRNVCLICMYAGKNNLGWFTKFWLCR